VQGQTISPAGRLVGRDHSVYRIPAKQAKLEGKSLRSCCVSEQRSKRQTWNIVRKYCHKCDVGLCIEQCFEVYHTKMNYWE